MRVIFIVAMPSEGDTSVMTLYQMLASHGLHLKWVYQRFCKEPGGFVFNALQLQQCQMVLVLDVTLPKGLGVAHHCVAWDGRTVWDCPHKIIVNNSSDRRTVESTRTVFKKLYPKKHYEKWNVVQAFAIAKLSDKRTRTRMMWSKKLKRDA